MNFLTPILKVLDNTATQDEREWVQNWIEESDENRLYYKDAVKIHAESNSLEKITLLDTNAEWSKFLNLVESAESSEATIIPLQKEKVESVSSDFSLVKKLALAASLLIIASLFFLIPDKYKDVYSGDSAMLVTLEDGTKVNLEPNSHLKYPVKFPEKGERIVSFDGKANFDVKSDSDRPFNIQSDMTGTQVLGTVLSLVADATSSIMEVEEGKVKLFDKLKPEVESILNTGDMIKYDENGFDTIKLGGVDFSEIKNPPITESNTISDSTQVQLDSTAEVEINTDFPRGTFLMGDLIKKLKENDKFKISGDAKYKDDARVKVSINESLEVILKQLEDFYEIEYKKDNCEECYNIIGLSPRKN